MDEKALAALRHEARAPLIELLREAMDEIGSIHFFPFGLSRQADLKNRIAEVLLREDGMIR